jgi:hypothetical protein
LRQKGIERKGDNLGLTADGGDKNGFRHDGSARLLARKESIMLMHGITS